ncbi:MAG TPA: hypothetical protein EYP08_02515, partial [Pyrodictiaceae archaeon]|nr:hypothetical protein [Pyrodictiaceae archaeon]
MAKHKADRSIAFDFMGEHDTSPHDLITRRYPMVAIINPYTKEVIVKKGEEITEEKAKEIEKAGIERVKVRSVLTCKAPFGVCAKCYGKDLGRRKPVQIGEAVGIIAAQSIGEPGTQLTMRTFHIGGVAVRGTEKSSYEATIDGKVRIYDADILVTEDKELVFINRAGKIIVYDPETKKEYDRYQIPYGSKLKISPKNIKDLKPGQVFSLKKDVSEIEWEDVKRGQTLVEWDTHADPILA